MVKHIVMWRMAESEDKAQRAKDIKENLEALKGKIDVLVNIEVGLNFNDTDAASDVVLVSEFETKEDLSTYQKSSRTQMLFGATYVRPYVAERTVFAIMNFKL